MPSQHFDIDIFCNVVDNYGDIGVTWRLARQLAAEHGQSVRLWVDEPAALAKMAPADPGLPKQVHAGVTLCRWEKPFPAVDPARVVIEAFACALPESYVAAMTSCSPAPVWINLEYLSAEAWVKDCHGLASPHPTLPLVKHFFFPGWGEGTGGLLREKGLIEARQAFEQGGRAAHLATLGISAPSDALILSLFCYDNPGLDELLPVWSAPPRPIVCLAPEGPALARLGRFFGRELKPGYHLVRGQLAVQVLPWTNQEGYDRLLWSCDFNFVRGEDSFVRAQWAGAPFAWRIYPQQDGAHWAKLDAFLEHYLAGLESTASDALQRFWQAWNRGEGTAEAWTGLMAHLPVVAAHHRRWSAELARQPDLAGNLMNFCAKLLK
jgi:uncharacterized repeat protein (TIGR03837 family)